LAKIATSATVAVPVNTGPNIVSGKPNLKNGSLQIAHINACSLLPKIDLIELEMSNNDIILVSETHLSRDIDNEDTHLNVGFYK
jgi:N-acetylmuramic acid 6-phosphate (MurNAc-6-P) etherase